MENKDNKKPDIFEEGFMEEMENLIPDKPKIEDEKPKEEEVVIPRLNWKEIEDLFKGELASKYVYEMRRLKGQQFMSKWLQFAEFVMPKKQRVEGVSGLQDTEITVNITKTIDQKIVVVKDILKDEGIEIPVFTEDKTE